MVRYANTEQTIEALALVGGLTVAQLRRELWGGWWDDLKAPASTINPVGLADAATRVTSLTGYTGALEFAGNAENVCAGIFQISHSWQRGTPLYFHIHWTKPTGSSSAVTWRLYTRIIGNPGDAPGAWSSAQTPSGTIGDQTVSDQHLLTYWPSLDMSGYIESAIVYWRLHRLGNTDADNTAVILHELDAHYKRSQPGTSTEIPVE